MITGKSTSSMPGALLELNSLDTRLLLVTLLLILSALGSYALAGEYETRILQLRHRDADEVMPILAPLLQGDGRISGRQYQLFVRTSEKNVAEIQRVLKEIDTPLRNMRISVRHTDNQNTAVREREISGDQRVGENTRIIVAPTAGNGGMVVTRTGKNGVVRYRTQQGTSMRSQDGTQFVNVLEGKRAYIAVGVSVPQVQTFLVLVGNRLAVANGVTYRDVSTGFEVLPRMRGDNSVDLEITPRVAFLGHGDSQTITFQELSTHVNVKVGEWIDLGGILSNSSQVSRTILGASSGRSEEQQRFEVRVE